MTRTGEGKYASGRSGAERQKAIAFTDFPGHGVTLYFCNDVIHLPSEY
jgi:hypothetical protein